jgi:hypothetical protein
MRVPIYLTSIWKKTNLSKILLLDFKPFETGKAFLIISAQTKNDVKDLIYYTHADFK